MNGRKNGKLGQMVYASSTEAVDAGTSAPAHPVATRLAELGDKLREKLWIFPLSKPDEIERAVGEALDVFDALGPQSIEEELVAERIVLARAAANVCLKLAQKSIVDPKMCTRFTNYHRQYTDEELKWKREWDKGRGRADQVVRVVNVKDGGQAMIGNVSLAPTGRPTDQAAPRTRSRVRPPGVAAPRSSRAAKRGRRP